MTNQVNSLVEDIKKNLSQCSASRKDEMRVMQAMLSDPDYEVNVYGKTGIVDTYNPCKDFRSMCSSIISSANSISSIELNSPDTVILISLSSYMILLCSTSISQSPIDFSLDLIRSIA